MRDSGLAVARDPNRIQLDPKFVGCTIAALVCGPIGNGCGCESRFVARVRTLTFRLPYPYRLFRSSTYTVKAYEPIPYGPFYMERYPLPPPPPPPPPPPRLRTPGRACLSVSTNRRYGRLYTLYNITHTTHTPHTHTHTHCL